MKNQVLKKEDKDLIYSYTEMPQSPKPTKTGIYRNSYKIIKKTSNNELIVVQNTNKGQIKYVLKKNVGASKEGRDYGVNHELIRLVGAYHLQESYLYYDISSPKNGKFAGVLYYPSVKNKIEEYWLNFNDCNENRSFSSKGDLDGIGCYKLKYGDIVEFDLEVSLNPKANIMFLSTPSSSQLIKVYVNNTLINTFNPRNFLIGDSNGIGIVEFNVPITRISNSSYTIKIENADKTGYFNMCGINCYKLSEYNGQFITDYKCIGSNKSGWLATNGANDYAMFESTTKKWLGSYHGGEISEFDSILWGNQRSPKNQNHLSNITFESIESGAWRVQNSFKMYQQTDLATGKGKMISNFDFDLDGTIDMEFSYYGGQLYFSNFYTALTCTHSNFNWLYYPIRKEFTEPTNQYYYFNTVEGKITQVNTVDELQLDIRFTRFNHKNNSRKTCIADNKAYRKFYYGVIYGEPYLLECLTFSKSLDFIVR